MSCPFWLFKFWLSVLHYILYYSLCVCVSVCVCVCVCVHVLMYIWALQVHVCVHMYACTHSGQMSGSSVFANHYSSPILWDTISHEIKRSSMLLGKLGSNPQGSWLCLPSAEVACTSCHRWFICECWDRTLVLLAVWQTFWWLGHLLSHREMKSSPEIKDEQVT